MIRKGIISKQKLTMDLRLLLKRGKIAGKAIRNLMSTFHHQDHVQYFYNPQEVEFSCSNTPFHLNNKRKNRKHHSSFNSDAVAAIAKAFEMINNNPTNEMLSDGESIASSVAPSPMIFGYFGKSPRMVRQLRITDSPFPINENDVVNDGKVDKEADAFIKKFYEQLQIQHKMAVATPENKFRRN